MPRKLQKYFIDLSLKKKLLIITIIVNIFLASITSVFGITLVIKANNKLLYKSIASSLSYSASDIEFVLNSVETLSSMIIADDIIQKQLSVIKNSKDELARSNAYKLLYTTIQTYFLQFKSYHLSYMSLYNDNFATHSYSVLAEQTPAHIVDEIIKTSIKEEGDIVWTTKYSEEYGLFISRSIREIAGFTLDNIGVLSISIDLNKLIKDSTDFSNQYENSLYLLFDKEQLIYYPSELSAHATQTIQSKLSDNYGIVTLDGHKYFGVKGSLPDYNWDYICLVSYDATHNSILLSYIFYIIIILTSILLSTFLSEFLFKLLTIHFDNLLIKMKAFKGQDSKPIDINYDYRNREDELGILHREFDNMASEIQNLIQVNYTNEILVKDAQIKAMETQMNPHFLYNILESVNWRAKAIGEQKISLMVESLGKLLRATLKKEEESFTLYQELELVNYYVTIQQIRFDDQLHYSLNVDEKLMNAFIPKLTIQPLVENAIQYALENIDECYINVSILLDHDNINIYVKNTGSQFEDNLLEKLITQKIKPSGTGIGLLNINNRLRLTFGDLYGLSTYNEGSDKAVAKITIPYQPVISYL